MDEDFIACHLSFRSETYRLSLVHSSIRRDVGGGVMEVSGDAVSVRPGYRKVDQRR